MPGLANDLNISESGYVTHNGSGVFHGRTFQAGTGITLTNADGISGNTTIASTASLTDLHTARFIVASSTAGTGANFTTIASAIASAQGTGINSTIFLQPGTYTENFTLPAGINLSAYICDAFTPNVTIVGTITCTTAGSRSISGIRLQTNSAAILSVTGIAATIVNIFNCYLNCTNNTGITYSSSSGSSAINIMNCNGDLGTTGISYFTATGTGLIRINSGIYTNTGGSTTASTTSACTVFLEYLQNTFPISTSSTGAYSIVQTSVNNSPTNTTSLTTAGTGITNITESNFSSGSASAISVGAGTTVLMTGEINSTNTNAITGSGTFLGPSIAYTNTSSLNNVSTQTARNLHAGGISFDGGTNTINNYVNWTSFTPTLVGQSTAGVSTYTIQMGLYSRIGNIVVVQVSLAVSAATGTGNVNIGGLPFTISNTAAYIPIGSCYLIGAGLTWPAGTTSPAIYGLLNTTTAAIFVSGTLSGGGFLQMANTAINISGSLVYRI